MSTTPPRPLSPTSSGRAAAAAMAAARQALADGLAHNAAGRPVRASARFRAALRRLDAPGVDAQGQEVSWIRARAVLGLVMSDFELRADVGGSLALLDEAESAALRAGDAATRVAVLGQRGLLWHRAGSPVEALREHDKAVARISSAEPVDACCILLNRGSLHLELGHLAEARSDLLDCATRAAGIGDDQLAFKARHNLGYAEYLAGDLPGALSAMAEAADAVGGESPPVALLDRAQVLLEAGLVTEADEMLARAGAGFAAQRLTLDLAQVELARAECALLLGRPSAALEWASTARRRLTRRGHPRWLAVARLTELRSRLDSELARRGDPDAVALGRIAADAHALAHQPGAGPGSDVARAAWTVRAAALAVAHRHDEAAVALRRAGRLTGREPLTLALAVHAVGATLAFGTGRPAIGRRRVAAGQQLLAAHRRQLGSVEAVTAAAVHGERLALIEVGAALRRGDPLAVLGAVERGRATFAGPARVRPPDDPRLAELLADLRRALERERAAQDAAGRAAAARVVDGLLAAARQRSWQAGGEAGAPPAPEPAALVEELAGSDRTVVDLVAVDGVVHAVVVDGSGARLHHLADLAEVRRTGRRVAADLQALSGSHLPRELRGVVRGSLETGLARLDELLLAPLGVTGSAHLVAGGTLVTVPWGLFPSRRGLATSVATRLEDRVSVGRRPGVLAVAGPGVPHAAAEVAAVTAAWGGGRSLLGAAATGRVTAAGLGEAGVVHLAAHGHHEPDNPLFSWVGLTDGPLFAHELEGTDLAGSLVVLSACELGQATVRPGGEALGMASVLLRLGADSVIAALASLRDDVAARLAPLLHAGVRDGASPAEALAALVDQGDELVPLVCLGARPAA